jgi:hypothetical protein
MTELTPPKRSLFAKFFVVFLLGITSCTGYYGYHYWRMVQRNEEMHARDTLRPKPVSIPIEVVGCTRGKPESGKFGYVDILDVRILVPCDVTPMTRDLTDGQFGLSWSGYMQLKNGRDISYRNIFENRMSGATLPMDRSRYPTQAGKRAVWIPMPSGAFQKQEGFASCDLDVDPSSASHCRLTLVTSEMTAVFIEAYQDGLDLTDAELTEVVYNIVSRVHSLKKGN